MVVQKQRLKFINPEADPHGIWRVTEKANQKWNPYVVSYENTKSGISLDAEAYANMASCMDYIMEMTKHWTTPPDFTTR